MFINGLGASSRSLVVGRIIDRFGPAGFFVLIGALLGGLTIYTFYRMTQWASVAVKDTRPGATLTPIPSPVALKIAQDYALYIAVEKAAT